MSENCNIRVYHEVNKGYPQIHFIPDNEKNESGEKIDYPVDPVTRPEQFERIKHNVNKRFKKHARQLKDLL